MSDWQSFLAGRGASLDPAGMAGFGNPLAELLAARDGTIVADLSHNALLAISGDDAAAFLHGQLTNDVQALATGGAQWNGWCSPKGRLLATFLLLRQADGFLMMLPAEIAEPVAKRLRMFVLRSKVKIEDASERLRRIGIAGRDARAALERTFGAVPAVMAAVEREGSTCVALGIDRFVIFADPASAPALWERLAAEATQAGTDAWEWTTIRAGIPTVVAKTQDEFVPQMANFELVGGVSFKKGCYPGQEIVARTQYRGILKRRMVRAHVSGAAPKPGDTLRSEAFGDQAAGVVANVAPSPEGGHDLLAVAQLEAIRSGDLRLADGPALRIEDLPYPTPGRDEP
ncbi:MAG TPA: folate-binding protein YgfZ [Usitatibacter sp.]|nr:folate-binding protein YgfZ [Usitatibacter sp.]